MRPPTDFELLNEIYNRHRADFEGHSEDSGERLTKILVPVDIKGIAHQFGVDPDSIFGRLYYHLEPKYGEPPTEEGQGERCSSRPLPAATATA
jgi:hypothetical protein